MAQPILHDPDYQKPEGKSQANYALILLTLMIVIGCASGLLSYGFGKRALKGVNSVPLGTKVPKIKPTPKNSTILTTPQRRLS